MRPLAEDIIDEDLAEENESQLGFGRSPSNGSNSSRMSEGSTMSTSSRKASGRASFRGGLLEKVERPMPLTPFCKKCQSAKPNSALALTPEEIEIRAHAQQVKEHAELQGSYNSLSALRLPPRQTRKARLKHYSEMLWAAAKDLKGSIRATGFSSFEDLKLPDQPARSRFSPLVHGAPWPRAEAPRDFGEDEGELRVSSSMVAEKLLSGSKSAKVSQQPVEVAWAELIPEVPTVPVVLSTMTAKVVSKLEVAELQKAKQPFIDACAQHHASAPREGHRQKLGMKFGTVAQLLTNMQKGEVTDQEKEFLLSKLKTAPLMTEVPEHMLETVASQLKVVNFAQGTELFQQGEEADGIYILLQGEVVLRNEISEALVLDAVKEAPAALLPGDVLVENTKVTRPFLLRPEGDRFRSRTVLASLSEDVGEISMTVLVPMEVLQMLSKHFRNMEAKERKELVSGLFASTMKLSPHICNKHRDIFEEEIFERTHVLVQSGLMCKLQDARLYFIVEGEVQLLEPRRFRIFRRKKTAKEANRAPHLVGRGRLLGEAAIYGEPYSHSAIVYSESVKVLWFRAVDYLQKLLGRPAAPLVRPPGRSVKSHEVEVEQKYVGSEVLAVVLHDAKKSTRLHMDLDGLQATEWKSVLLKENMPLRRTPNDPSPKAVTHIRAREIPEDRSDWSPYPSERMFSDSDDSSPADSPNALEDFSENQKIFKSLEERFEVGCQGFTTNLSKALVSGLSIRHVRPHHRGRHLYC